MSESQPTTHTSNDNQTELEKLIRKCGPWIAANATTLIYALAAFLAIAAVYVYMNRVPDGNIEASRILLMAASPEDYRDVADEFPNTKIGVWSRLRQADRLRDDAVTQLFKDRVLGMEVLEQSEAAYQQLAGMDLDEQVRERVLIGLARVADAKLDGTQETAETAIAAYQRVLDDFESSIDKENITKRIAQIGTEESKAWNAWFTTFKPTPASSVPDMPGLGDAGLGAPAAPTATADEVSTSPDTEAAAPTEMKEPEPSKEDAAAAKEDVAEDGKAADKKPVEDAKADADAKKEAPTEKADAPAEKQAADKKADKQDDSKKKEAAAPKKPAEKKADTTKDAPAKADATAKEEEEEEEAAADKKPVAEDAKN